MACTKQTLAEQIAENTNLNPQAAHNALENLFEIMKATLESRYFGTTPKKVYFEDYPETFWGQDPNGIPEIIV